MSPYSKKPPCFDGTNHCTKRTIGCHAKCKEFIDWDRDRKKKLSAFRKQKEEARRLDDSYFQRIKKIREGRGRKCR